jgi:hypothetical protein|tara:strand:+ start:292 stop:1146 length:855 start_codon:yes stop_codon:yes gene_type:complete
MKIKHSKFKNTGLIFELLVKQIASDTLSNKESQAIKILRKYYSGNTSLVKEFKLYEFITKNQNVNQNRAEAILSTITEVSRKLNQSLLKKKKYELISEIKKHYNVDEFFGIQVPNYKALAALYCLLEAQNSNQLVNPKFLVDNKTTLLEHLTSASQTEKQVTDSLVEEYSKYDKDLKLLTFKILLEKFNDNYKDLLPEQKNILKEFITSVDSTPKLKNLVNKELTKIEEEVAKLSKKVKDPVISIKLNEVAKSIKSIGKKEKVSDIHLVNIMQYYDLVNELKSL